MGQIRLGENMSKLHMLASVGLCVLALAPPLAARAADSNTVGEVVVTATKTGATNLQKTAISVDVVGSQDLKKEGIETFRDLQNEVPSLKLHVSGTNPRVFIRGIGGFNANDGDVSLYLDGVYLARDTAVTQSTFNDLNRIEVVEGPQGTVFGRNSTGGAVNFVSQTPSDHFTFNNSLSVGNYSLIDEQASISGPLADNMQASLSFSHLQHLGYLHNVLGAGDPDAANRYGVRGQLRWEPTSDITNTVRADYIYTNEMWQTNQVFLSNLNGKINFSPLTQSYIGNLRDVVYAIPPYNHEQAYGVSDEFNWKFNDHLSLKSISAGRTDFSVEDQGSPTEYVYSFGPNQFNEYQLSQEFNLINSYGPISGVVGLYYYLDHNYYTASGYLPGGNPAVPAPTAGSVAGQLTEDPTVSRAAFIQETYHITPTISVTAGVRYTQETKTFNTYSYSEYYNPGAPNNLMISNGTPIAPATKLVGPQPGLFIADLNHTANATTPKFEADWQATPDALLYASATNGYKSGGYNETGRALGPALSFGPENIWAYEAGAKTDWFDHSLRVNVAFFRYNWSGLQFKSSIGVETTAVSNAGGAVTNGFEANVIYKPARGLTLEAHTTLLDAKYTSFNNFSPQQIFVAYLTAPRLHTTNGLTLYNATGNHLVEAPAVSLSTSAQKDFDLANGADLFVRGEYEYTSRVYFDPSNIALASQPAYSIVNGSIGYSPSHSHWIVSLWGKNLADTRYIVGIGTSSIFTAAIGDPRTFGLRIDYTY